MLLHEFLTHEQACRLFKFSTVRNPFDSVLSEYVKQRSTYQPLLGNPNTWVQSRPAYKEAMHYATEHSFEEWLERSWARRFPRSLKRRYETASGALAWQDGMDFVMRFERLQQDFDEVMRRLGLASVTIPRLNETTGRDRDYRSAYTRKARRIVEKVYAPLLERYDYAF
jgi:hypothetical protein